MEYLSLVKRGEISPLLSFKVYDAYSRAVQNNLLGVQTTLALQIEGYTSHFISRVIGHSALNQEYNRDGVPLEALLDCLKNGTVGKTQINAKGERSILLKSNECNIAINPDKKILLQCNPK